MTRRRWTAFLGFAAVVLATPLAKAGQTPRFEITHPPELADVANEVMQLAADDYSRVLELTGLVGFSRSIHVVLAAEGSPTARRTPAWVSGFARGRDRSIVLFPARVPHYPDRSMRTLLHHEVAHVLVAEAAGGRPVPRWFNEGVATVAAREWGFEDRAQYALAVVGRGLRSTADLDAEFARGGRRVARAYALSAAFVRYLRRRTDDAVTARILSGVAEGRTFREAFVMGAGLSLTRVERSFFVDQALWYTWVPFLTSSVALWMAITLLALVAIHRRRQRSRELHIQWAREDAAMATTGRPDAAPDVAGDERGETIN